MRHSVTRMAATIRVLVCALVCLGSPVIAGAASDATLFRLFLLDGSTVVSYGEYARVDDRVIFSMPVGALDDSRLHVVTLSAALIDWPRTDRYAVSVRYQHYADTRGEQDFELLTTEVAAALNQIAMTTNRQRALEIAQQARQTLAAWPRAHYGYRQQDVREIIALLDESISELRAASGASSFDVSLEAIAAADLEPVVADPTPRELLDQLLHVAAVTQPASERLALLQAGLDVLSSAQSGIQPPDSVKLRRSTEEQIRQELTTDSKYIELAKRLVQSAHRAAAHGSVNDVQDVLNDLSKQDERLGKRRPEIVEAIHTSLQTQLESARHQRLLRDQWVLRRKLYREYTLSTGSWMFLLVKTQPTLESIRRLEGPSLGSLEKMQKRLEGGAETLQRLAVPDSWRATHNLVVTAWRFADNAVRIRQQAVASGNLTTAWEASSAAAAALLMLSRAQQEIRTLLEPPQLQ